MNTSGIDSGLLNSDFPVADIIQSRPPIVIKKQNSTEKIHVRKSVAADSSSVSEPTTYQVRRSARQGHLNSIKTIDCKANSIKEEDEPPDTTVHNNNRIRKTNDRIFIQISPKLPALDNLIGNNSRLREFPSDQFSLNPRINIEKSLGSAETSDLSSRVTKPCIPSMDLLGPNDRVKVLPQRKSSLPALPVSLELRALLKPRERSVSPAR